MNKEEIIEEIEACYNEDCYKYGECVELNNDECKILLHYIQGLEYENERLKQKVNQLETNRDEAIEYLNNCIITEVFYDTGSSDLIPEADFFKDRLLEILERGKE